MPTAFVTGATGFLGRHIIDVLLANRWAVTAMVRNHERALASFGPEVTLRVGDLTHPNAVIAAMPRSVECVFHAAADTGTWSRDNDRQSRTNVGGTREVLRACLERRAGRLVHVSSITVFGIHDDRVTETSERRGIDSWVGYVRTKAHAEEEVRDACRSGLNAVIVNPTHIVGRYDLNNWARLIQMIARNMLPGVPPGGGNFANGRAVAEAIVSAYENGRTGEAYILGGPYATFWDFVAVACTALGKPKPPGPAPRFVLAALSRLLASLSMVTGKRPRFTPEEVYFACEVIDACSTKAVDELGYRLVPLEDSIRESIAFMRDEGLIEYP